MYRKNLQGQTPVYNDGYTKLGNAIIIQAVKDYRDVLKKLNKNSENSMAKHMKRQIEDFFHFSLFGMITTMDPDMLIRKLNEEVVDYE